MFSTPNKRSFHFAVSVVFALAVAISAGCGIKALSSPGDDAKSPAPPSALSADVHIENFTFDPPLLEIPAGTRVTWVNRDDIPHTVKSDDHKFGSQALDTDDQFSFEFDTPGNYPYYCSIHPHMTAEIRVK